ncbi:molybdopterin-dependent oxidoreductase [Sandaracinobacter sp. RS1-74]|uniref:molybdopterin-dependent oxidoreductase n=1 Tax=Sandaracinobacteroides sayramensis TaxID=2913411 RepID=UPI001EDABEB3|nr:molybdopterin-dependent oxidoreductase [Sandaracinobacteroides sayramensis]MCG2840831.1 molybdopterin-dependent oxidoreductase [Sandaracinobacteroides sayramensis]
MNRSSLQFDRRALLAGLAAAAAFPARAGAASRVEIADAGLFAARMPTGAAVRSLRIGGLVRRPLLLDLGHVAERWALDERRYRLRGIEGWSMWVPWLGLPLSDLLRLAAPLAEARYVRFTAADGRREGLRLDEALHPLTLFALGAHGRRQRAPRIVVPWKYAFKSIGGPVAIDLVRHEPLTAHRSHGFYANVEGPGLGFNGYAGEVAGLYAEA